MLSHHQDAAREYLEAYKLMPECPLINLCAGKASIFAGQFVYTFSNIKLYSDRYIYFLFILFFIFRNCLNQLDPWI